MLMVFSFCLTVLTVKVIGLIDRVIVLERKLETLSKKQETEKIYL